MEFETLEKEWRTNSNWRAHITKYIESQKELKKQKKGDYSPEQYCKRAGLNYEAFQCWLEFLKKEDKYVFYVSFATEYLSRAKYALELLEKYEIPELRMPLIRDAIVAYAAPFSKSNGRIFTKWSLKEIENFVPSPLQSIHKKICDDRNEIVAHCDLGPRNPRVGLIGICIRMAGYYWEDYQKLIPDFKKLILAVQENLGKYNKENFTPMESYFRDFLNPPKCTEEDPGPPSEKIS
ncbi:MAG: hypothetical protein ABSH16_06105 [Sedimentisphaerales bacterium]